MKSRTVRISLDCAKVGNQVCIDGIRQGDSNSIVFIISLKNGVNLLDIVAGKEESVVVTMYAKKADGKTIVRDCGINEDGNILYTLHTQDTSCVGIVSYQLIITSTRNKILASPAFSTIVEERNLYKTYTVLTAEPDDWAEGYDKYYYYEDGRFYKLNRFERDTDTAPDFVINTYYAVNNDEVESTSDFDALEYALLRAKQYADKAEEYLEEVKKKADKATTLDGYGITDAYNTTQIDNFLKNKLDTMPFDSKPNKGSPLYITSGTVYKALLNKADTDSVYDKTNIDALLATKANTADVEASIATINLTIDDNKKSVDTSLESLNTRLNAKADNSVVTEINNRVEANTADLTTKADKATTLDGYGITDAIKNANGVIGTSHIASGAVGLTQMSSIVQQQISSIGDKANADDVTKELAKKYNTSNIESGKGTLSPAQTIYDGYEGSFNYVKTGNIVTVALNITTLIAGKNYVQFAGLPFRAMTASKLSSIAVYTTANKLVNIRLDGTWFYVSSPGTTFTDGEKINAIVTYIIG